MSAKSSTYRIVVAADDTNISKKAIQHAIKLCSKLSHPYHLDVIFAIGLNPLDGMLLSGLDRMNNVDIQQDAKETIERLDLYLAEFDETKSSKVVQIEGVGEVGHLIEEYINRDPPDMLVVGSSSKEGIQKFIMGSVSDHCLLHCHCPVLIIKQNTK